MNPALIEFINLYFIPALTAGSIYALGAVGITMIFGTLRFAHFAHGDVMTVGAYGTLAAVRIAPIPPLLALPFGIALAVVCALVVDWLFYRPLRKLPTIFTVISSFGVALIFRSLIQIIAGSESQAYISGITYPIRFFDTFHIALLHLEAITLTAVIAVLLHLFLSRTRVGRSMRAVADEPELAAVAGLDTEAVIRWTWIIGAGLAAVAGVIAGLDTDVHPNLGWNLILPMFAATILGGIGRPLGAMAGGMIIGLAEELSSYPWLSIEPFTTLALWIQGWSGHEMLLDDPLISPSYKTAVAFVIMVALLIFRPRGLFKGRLL